MQKLVGHKIANSNNNVARACVGAMVFFILGNSTALTVHAKLPVKKTTDQALESSDRRERLEAADDIRHNRSKISAEKVSLANSP